ncbi:MAG: DISARM system phospholipase D-like protein DrmC [Capsulimonas sp.]|uniref:DISARM system phospholipase D-like protein DrmC n=1 Tax=Capsulimonas sp. TaxID=2494211 RepID=UPI0032673545
MIDHLRAVPSHLLQRLASALETGQLDHGFSAISLRFAIGTAEYSDAILSGLSSLASNGISGPGAGAWLRTLDAATASAAKPDVVWSGPFVPGLHARETRWVYEELLSSAKYSIWASTYAFFDGPKAFEIMARTLDANPGLSVRLLLNIQRRRGDTSTPDEVVRRFAEHFWNVDWPGVRCPTVYFDPRSLEQTGPTGVLHAKAVVIDNETTFITSANLTEAALDRNVELGVLLRDRSFSLTVAGYFQALIDKGMLRPLPHS